MAQEPVFQHSCLQPFIDHPSNDTIRDSLVKKRTQVGVRNRPKIVFDVEIYHPTQSVAHEASTQRLQGLMSGATWPEAVGAGKKVLLIDGLQHHDNRPLRHLIFEGWEAEGPKRSGSITLGDVHPPDRRCLIAAGLDALQEMRKIGLQVLRILCRRHTVDAGGTILAGEPVGFPHPFQIDDMVQRGQSHPAFRSCQFSYPLSFCGQVYEPQSSLLCPVSGSLRAAPPFPRSGPGESSSPTSQVVLRCYDFPLTQPRSLIWFASGAHAIPPCFVLAAASAPGRVEVPPQAGIMVQPAILRAGAFSRGRKWDLSGFQATRPVPLPRSTTPAEPTFPRQ